MISIFVTLVLFALSLCTLKYKQRRSYSFEQVLFIPRHLIVTGYYGCNLDVHVSGYHMSVLPFPKDNWLIKDYYTVSKLLIREGTRKIFFSFLLENISLRKHAYSNI